jgi:hypothetical protein
MKIFQTLLAAPALLGLLSPMTAKATDINLDTISNYNQNKIDLDSNSFKSNLDKEPILLSGGEGLVDETSVDESSFSETTTASFGSTFYVGSVENSATGEAVTFSYDFGMDLSTSFTGEDSLDVAIIGGDAGTTAVDGFMGGDMATVDVEGTTVNTPDALVLDGVSYTFPLGGATVIVGDGVGVDDLNTGACAYSAFTDLLSDCGANNLGGSADSGFAIAYDFDNGFTLAGGAAGGTSTDGLFTEEDASTLGVEAAYTADTYGVSVAYTDDEATTFWTVNAMITPEGFPSISVGYETDDDDADAIFAGLTFDEVGPGSVSIGMASTATDADDFYQYELSYSYPLNDGMTITPGVFIAETAGDDETGVVVTTSFSF